MVQKFKSWAPTWLNSRCPYIYVS